MIPISRLELYNLKKANNLQMMITKQLRELNNEVG